MAVQQMMFNQAARPCSLAVAGPFERLLGGTCWQANQGATMTTQASAEDWKELYETAVRHAAEWRENFQALQHALVGETGASGIEVAHALRKDAERYRWLRHGDNDDACIEVANGFADAWLLRGEKLDAAIDYWIEHDAKAEQHVAVGPGTGAA